MLQLIVQFEKRWIHLVGSVVANYAQPIRPICLVTALQGPRPLSCLSILGQIKNNGRMMRKKLHTLMPLISLFILLFI